MAGRCLLFIIRIFYQFLPPPIVETSEKCRIMGVRMAFLAECCYNMRINMISGSYFRTDVMEKTRRRIT